MISTPTRGIFLTRVAANVPLCRDHFRMVLEVEGFPAAVPGQFLQIFCGEPGDMGQRGLSLRRPFSIGGLRPTAGGCELDVYYRVFGSGTRWMGKLAAGAPVSIIGPLGRGFWPVADRPLSILVGGGIGLPPLIWLAEQTAAVGGRALAFVGARTAEILPLTRRSEVPIRDCEPALAFEEFARSGVSVALATDDGSLGFPGLIPHVLKGYLHANPAAADTAAVFACGPEAMMRAVAEVCEPLSIPCQVSMERSMACGMGTCQSCIVPVHDQAAQDAWRYRLCCTDGPVFDSLQVIWTRP
jgi:dihydroorotate dehydrogenase electron transfer subunit